MRYVISSSNYHATKHVRGKQKPEKQSEKIFVLLRIMFDHVV